LLQVNIPQYNPKRKGGYIPPLKALIFIRFRSLAKGSNLRYLCKMRVYFKKQNEMAQTPARKEGNAGYDLFYAGGNHEIHPMQRALLDTGIAMELPAWAYGRIADRSGMALKQGLHVLGGVVDSSYRGSIGVILINLGDTKVEIKKGDRIAQLIIEQAHEVKFVEVDQLTNTERGVTGYGASGR